MTTKRKKKPVRTRAFSESAKRERRAVLLSSAERLFSSRDYQDVSMEDIAKAAGLAKGTVYLYFQTKEALFLELVWEGMSAWQREVRDSLDKIEQRPAALAVAISATLSQRPTLVRLLALLHSVLEQNTDPASLSLFKHRLLALTAETATVFEKVLHLRTGTGARLVLWMHALVVGLAQMTSPPPVLKKVLAADAGLAPFVLDFRSELESSLQALFTGASVGRAILLAKCRASNLPRQV